MIRADIDHRITRVGKVGTFEVGIAKQCPLEIRSAKIGFLEGRIAKIDLFGSTFPHKHTF